MAADTELVASLGADEVVLRGDDVADRFRALEPNRVDGVLDGAVQNELILPAMWQPDGVLAGISTRSTPRRKIALR
ncbi:MAG: hypothetical protein ACJ786_15470 [Catenulispora sp.]